MDKRILDIHGWMDIQYLEWIQETINNLPDNSLIVELGAWKGKSTLAMLLAKKSNDILVTVDTWLGQPNLRTAEHRDSIRGDLFLEFMYNMPIKPEWYSGQSEGFYYLRMESILASILFANKSVDFLFIDSDHTKFGEDIDAWYRKIKTGGIISGHDYNWPGAKEAIDDRIDVIGLDDMLWYGYK
jgi:predicted O-methyltransferase YrrM